MVCLLAGEPYGEKELWAEWRRANEALQATACALRSRKARERVKQWAVLHRGELEANWTSMKAGKRSIPLPAKAGWPSASSPRRTR